jgi:hypothetical protein
MIKEFRAFFTRNAPQSGGSEPDQQANYPVTWQHPRYGTVGNRWLKNHWPTEDVIKKLFASIPFLLNRDSRALDDNAPAEQILSGPNRVQGLVTVATDAQAKANDNGDTAAYTRVPKVSQLPTVEAGSNPSTVSNPLSGATISVGTGLVNVSETGTTRNRFVVRAHESLLTLLQNVMQSVGDWVSLVFMSKNDYAEDATRVKDAVFADDLRRGVNPGPGAFYYGTTDTNSAKDFYPLPVINPADFNSVDPWDSNEVYDTTGGRIYYVSYAAPANPPVGIGRTILYKSVISSLNQPPVFWLGSSLIENTSYWEAVSENEYVASQAHQQNTDTALGVPNIGTPFQSLEIFNRLRYGVRGGIIVVSQYSGNDAAALIDHSTSPYSVTNRPFASLEAAIDAAILGDMIYVCKGTYGAFSNTVHRYSKDKVDWFFEQGTTVVRGGSGTMFSISNDRLFSVYGRGVFVQEAVNSTPLVEISVTATTNPGEIFPTVGGVVFSFSRISYRSNTNIAGTAVITIQNNFSNVGRVVKIEGELIETNSTSAIYVLGLFSDIVINVDNIRSTLTGATSVVNLPLNVRIIRFTLRCSYCSSVTINGDAIADVLLEGNFGGIVITDGPVFGSPSSSSYEGLNLKLVGTTISYSCLAVNNSIAAVLDNVQNVNIVGGNTIIGVLTLNGDPAVTHTISGGQVKATLVNLISNYVSNSPRLNISGGHVLLTANINSPYPYRALNITGGYTELSGTIKMGGVTLFSQNVIFSSPASRAAIITQTDGILVLKGRLVLLDEAPLNTLHKQFSLISQEGTATKTPVLILDGATLSHKMPTGVLIFKFYKEGQVRTMSVQANKDFRTYQSQIVEHRVAAGSVAGNVIGFSIIVREYSGTIPIVVNFSTTIPSLGGLTTEDYRAALNTLATSINGNTTINPGGASRITAAVTPTGTPVLTLTGTTNATNGDAWDYSGVNRLEVLWVQQIQRPITTAQTIEQFGTGIYYINSNVQ